MQPKNHFVVFTLSFCLLLASCHQQPSDTMFTSLSPSQTNVDFTNKLEKRELFNILYYLYYYNGGGVSVGDINNDGLPDIYFTANSKGHNKLYLNKGDFKFEDITVKAGVAGTSDWCTGSTMADVNGDGLLDIYVCAVSKTHGLTGHNELFINNGNGSFTESGAKYGLDFSGFSTQAAFFDYDHDGDLDAYILNQSHRPNNNIVDTSNRRKYDPNTGDRLYRNDGNKDGHWFTDVSATAGIYQSSLGYGLGIAVADMNNDGWDDIYIGNDFHENDYYYINNGNGTFTESGAKHFQHYSRFSMGNDIADYNNDGQPDVVTVDMLPPDERTLKTYGSDEHFDTYQQKILGNGFQNQTSRNCLQENNGNGESFSDAGLLAGVSATDWSWCPLFADFDNDGNKDLFISSGIVKRPVDLDYVRYISDLHMKKGIDRNKTDKYDDEALNNMPDGASHPFLYKGDGKFNFSDVSDHWGTGKMKGYFNGAAYADLDNDGNLDLVVNCLNATSLILKNNAPGKNFLSIEFKGEGMNTKGVGAKAYLFSDKKMQYQQLMLTRGFESSSDTRLHFGLDSVSLVDSILVVWTDQRHQVLRNVPAGKKLIVEQANATAGFSYAQYFPRKKPAFENITDQVQLGWKHRENSFIDFNIQYLLPHMESTRGPKMAVADVNKDGLDDFFVCGAKGQGGALFLQTAQGHFILGDSAVFNKNNSSEGVDAIFFDANNDGFSDLYVVSGGNEYEDGAPGLADHLYINDGKGHFTEATSGLPVILKNKSCVAAADVNKDGFTDLFVGGLADARKFGYAQPSYLLLNDGKGNFRVAGQDIIGLKETGIVTTASFLDINKDGWPDLAVTGEWMPLKIFLNNKGVFKESAIAVSTGLWQSIHAADVNGDGNMDILAGNWGHNCKLYSGKNGPLKLYVKDFDKNGSTEQVMAYTIDGKEYPFLAKDELEAAIPVLKKAYLRYSDVAGKTVQYMFYDLFKDSKELMAETLTSSCFINDGKGNFSRKDLPEELQLAPIFSFATLPSGSFMAAGNFFGAPPYEGRYDALLPTLFSYDKGGSRFSFDATLPATAEEMRDAKWLNYKGGKKILLLSGNNGNIIFLDPNQ
ncbi:MAG TPA: VCBS repeat-containing protein [Chitinophagaceae bacterium]|nr:VCBS repeat-containing protein [Chitinophagaceae bacterium]